MRDLLHAQRPRRAVQLATVSSQACRDSSARKHKHRSYDFRRSGLFSRFFVSAYGLLVSASSHVFLYRLDCTDSYARTRSGWAVHVWHIVCILDLHAVCRLRGHTLFVRQSVGTSDGQATERVAGEQGAFDNLDGVIWRVRTIPEVCDSLVFQFSPSGFMPIFDCLKAPCQL